MLQSGLIHGFTTKKIDGSNTSFTSDPALINSSALPRLTQSFGLQKYKFVFQRQVHGNDIKIINITDLKNDIAVFEDNDGLITNEPGVCLISLSADCMSLLLAHPETGSIANAHCGRRGTLLRLPAKLLFAFCSEYHIPPSDVIAIMGTSISVMCYEVGEDILSELKSLNPDSLGFLLNRNGQRYFDLRGFVFYQLTSSGVISQNIFSQTKCSHCDSDLFYSYRRDGQVLGSQAGFIATPLK
ncbi:MAG: polyphenol oxidase family protein [bacterium]